MNHIYLLMLVKLPLAVVGVFLLGKLIERLLLGAAARSQAFAHIGPLTFPLGVFGFYALGYFISMRSWGTGHSLAVLAIAGAFAFRHARIHLTHEYWAPVRLPWAGIAALLFGIILLYVAMLSGGHLEQYPNFIEHDISYYGKLTAAMMAAGREAFIYDPFLPVPGYSPYHYFELWLAAALSHIGGTPYVNLFFVVHPLLKVVLVIQVALAICSATRLSSNVAFSLACLVLVFTGIDWSRLGSFPLSDLQWMMRNDFLSPFSSSLKRLPLAIGIATFIILQLRAVPNAERSLLILPFVHIFGVVITLSYIGLLSIRTVISNVSRTAWARLMFDAIWLLITVIVLAVPILINQTQAATNTPLHKINIDYIYILKILPVLFINVLISFIFTLPLMTGLRYKSTNVVFFSLISVASAGVLFAFIATTLDADQIFTVPSMSVISVVSIIAFCVSIRSENKLLPRRILFVSVAFFAAGILFHQLPDVRNLLLIPYHTSSIKQREEISYILTNGVKPVNKTLIGLSFYSSKILNHSKYSINYSAQDPSMFLQYEYDRVGITLGNPWSLDDRYESHKRVREAAPLELFRKQHPQMPLDSLLLRFITERRIDYLIATDTTVPALLLRQPGVRVIETSIIGRQFVWWPQHPAPVALLSP